MMSKTKTGTHTHTQPSPCGCGPCEETCCKLECLERPSFFCGQMLTDEDLTSLVKWTQERFRLARYRHGWGVVCGLHVRCNPKIPTGVIIGEGYAMDCCGRDIVLCKDVPFDLGKACPEPECRDPWQTANSDQTRQETGLKTDCEGLISDSLALALHLDLYLHYNETPVHPRPSMGGCSCGSPTLCKNTRVKEGCRFSWQTSVEDKDPWTAAYDAWLMAYQRSMAQALQLVKDLIRAGGVRAVAVPRLEAWLAEHHLQTFCFAYDLLDNLKKGNNSMVDMAMLTRLVFYILMDYRLAWLKCDCAWCKPDTGIPLARVWLQTPDYDGQTCKVLLINDHPPYRRDLRPDVCWPAQRNWINLGQYIWMPPSEVEADLQTAGVALRCEKAGAMLANMEGLFTLLNWNRENNQDHYDEMQACRGSIVYAYTVDLGAPWGERIVAFTTTT